MIYLLNKPVTVSLVISFNFSNHTKRFHTFNQPNKIQEIKKQRAFQHKDEKMCYALYHVHAECLHIKKVDVIEECEGSERDCTLVPVFFKEITAPLLCLSCFREEEAKIDADYQLEVEHIRRKMAEYESTLEDRQIRGRAQGAVDSHIAELEQDLVEVKELRDLGIQAFRKTQGVWADG